MMSQEKVWPVIQLAHYLVKRDGEVCDCVARPSEPAAVCQVCWGTGFVGGYVLRSASVNYYLVRASHLEGVEGWTTKTYRSTAPVGLEATNYAQGDFLLDRATGDRWKIIEFNDGNLLTRKIQPFEASARLPVLRDTSSQAVP